ncbi:MAG: hypothetical protein MZV70_46315, partial [Desulfobacterales bacterium]|nr:hypothetical protein [Desulfobacterales bacterium]
LRIAGGCHKDTDNFFSTYCRPRAGMDSELFRINVIPIHLPPLRERSEDIPLLARSFFRRIKLKSEKTIEGIGNDAIEILMNYPWPGNIRELKSAFEYAFVNCHEALIRAHHLPLERLAAEGVESGQERHGQRDMQRSRLVEALEKTNGHLTQAARMLGTSWSPFGTK